MESKREQLSDYRLFVYRQDECEYFRRALGLIGVESFNENLSNVNQQENVMILSWDGQYEMTNYFINLGCNNVERIYDAFEEEGVRFTSDFYDIFHQAKMKFDTGEESCDYDGFDPNLLFFFCKRIYEKSPSGKIKAKYLQMMIFICVFYYDFASLEKYINIYCESRYDKYEVYDEFLGRVRNLLVELKGALLARNKKDVLMMWLDALEYGEDKEMPFLSSVDKKAFVFDNIFTVTPYTGPTFKTLFAKSRAIEENGFKLGKINASNSGLLKYLHERNYDFRYYGAQPFVDGDSKGNGYISIYTPICTQLWYSLMDCLHSECSVFMVVHSLIHTHDPHISFAADTKELINWAAWPGRTVENEHEKRKRQECSSKMYADEQVKFYTSLLPGKMYKIYMSDHGHTFWGKFHPIMKIMQEDITPQRYQNLVSYYEFDKIIHSMIENDLNKLDINNEYVRIQDVDYYNGDYINFAIKRQNFTPDGLIGYQGVITLDEIYFKTFDGNRFYKKNKNDNCMVTDERLDYLDEIKSSKRPNIYTEEKFKYSRLYIDAEKRNRERLSDRLAKIECVLFEYFHNIKDEDVLGVRCGAMHTYRLLLMLPWSLRKKVRYVIDRDVDCICSGLGIQIIREDEVKDCGINVVLLSTFYNRTDVRRQLHGYAGVRIDDFYELLEKEGISCDIPFYERKYIREDFEG